MTDIILPDDNTRPKAPKIRNVTAWQRNNGKRLALFHEMHLRELARVRRAMERVAAGEGSAADLAKDISSLQMISNYRQFGNLCGAACDMLTGHHSIEDAYVFPRLKGHSDGLTKVIERLQLEHGVIHSILVRLEAAAIALITDPGPVNAAALRAVYLILEEFVVSHFGYEQGELEEALGSYEIGI